MHDWNDRNQTNDAWKFLFIHALSEPSNFWVNASWLSIRNDSMIIFFHFRNHFPSREPPKTIVAYGTMERLCLWHDSSVPRITQHTRHNARRARDDINALAFFYQHIPDAHKCDWPATADSRPSHVSLRVEFQNRWINPLPSPTSLQLIVFTVSVFLISLRVPSNVPTPHLKLTVPYGCVTKKNYSFTCATTTKIDNDND